jgi:hypothetical protein
MSEAGETQHRSTKRAKTTAAAQCTTWEMLGPGDARLGVWPAVVPEPGIVMQHLMEVRVLQLVQQYW